MFNKKLKEKVTKLEKQVGALLDAQFVDLYPQGRLTYNQYSIRGEWIRYEPKLGEVYHINYILVIRDIDSFYTNGQILYVKGGSICKHTYAFIMQSSPNKLIRAEELDDSADLSKFISV